MPGADQNNSKDSTITGKRLNLRVTYTPELSGQLSGALDFVMNKIGFMPAGESYLPEEKQSPILLHDLEGNILTILLQRLDNHPDIQSIIFHTNDCLRDYHKYILCGVEFTSRPEYRPAGLQVSFIDNANNCYILLEERNYNEA